MANYRFQIISKMYALKKGCVHPSTRSPYILSISGGKDNSIEDAQVRAHAGSPDTSELTNFIQNGITHAFILQFYSNEDRDYYVDEDPVHQAFKKVAALVLEKAQVIDFQDGVFTKPGRWKAQEDLSSSKAVTVLPS